MARVHCTLPSPPAVTTEWTLVGWPATAAEAAAEHDREDDLNGSGWGPGWFASSWALQHGLDVREGLPSDANLHEWLAVCLGETCAPQRAAMRDTASPRSITAIA